MMRTTRRSKCRETERYILERWQSGRMRRIRNPVYGYAVTWVRIPPSPPETRTPLVGVFAFLEKRWRERPRSDRFVRNEIVAEAWPRAQRGARCMDAPNNSTLCARTDKEAVGPLSYLHSGKTITPSSLASHQPQPLADLQIAGRMQAVVAHQLTHVITIEAARDGVQGVALAHGVVPRLV